MKAKTLFKIYAGIAVVGAVGMMAGYAIMKRGVHNGK